MIGNILLNVSQRAMDNELIFIARIFNVKNRRYKIGIFRLLGDLNPRTHNLIIQIARR